MTDVRQAECSTSKRPKIILNKMKSVIVHPKLMVCDQKLIIYHRYQTFILT